MNLSFLLSTLILGLLLTNSFIECFSKEQEEKRKKDWSKKGKKALLIGLGAVGGGVLIGEVCHYPIPVQERHAHASTHLSA